MSEVLSYETFRNEIEEQNRKVAGWLLFYPEMKEWMEEEKEKIRQGVIKSIRYSHEAKSKTNKVNDSVANIIVRIDEIERTKKAQCVRLIEDVMMALPLEKRVFLGLKQKYRYYRGCRGKTGAYTKIQIEYAKVMSQQTGMSEEEVWKEIRTLQSWWREIVEVTVRLALQRNLL